MTTFKAGDRVYRVINPHIDPKRPARLVLGTVTRAGRRKYSTDPEIHVQWDDEGPIVGPQPYAPEELVRERDARLDAEQALIRDLVKDIISAGLGGTPAFRHLYAAAEIIAAHSGSGIASLWSTTLGRVDD